MKIQSPWMGRIKGSAGNMTGCKVYDKNVMRAKAFEVNNPNTAAQQVQRGYFADLTKLVASFTPDQLRTLFPSKPKTMSRRNALSKQLAEYNTMEGTEKVIDFANIDTLGNAPTKNLVLTDISFLEHNMNIEWNEEDFVIDNNFELQVIAIVINETKKELLFKNTSSAIGSASLVVDTPSHWDNADSVYAIPFITNTTTQNPDFGSFIIKVRPEKKSH
jgi:hypothetical protein